MATLWLMPSWSAPSELWMQRMLRAVEDRLAFVACYEPAASTWNGRVPTIDLGRRADPRSIESGRSRLAEAVHSSAVTHILAHYLPFALRYESILASADKPLYVHCHGYDVTWDLKKSDPPHERFHAPDYPDQVRRLSERATIIANSKSTAAKLTQIGIRDSRIIIKYLGVPVPSQFLDRSNYHGPLRILYLGRLVDFKGPDVLIRVFDLACSGGLDATLTFGGDGPLRATCERLRDASAFRERISFIGPYDATAGESLRANADLFSTHNRLGPVTGQEEAFGVAVAEAMAAGLPVLSTTSGSLPELVADGRTGLLVDPGDVDGHAAAFQRLASDVRLRLALGRAARQRAAAFFSDTIERDHLRHLLGGRG